MHVGRRNLLSLLIIISISGGVISCTRAAPKFAGSRVAVQLPAKLPSNGKASQHSLEAPQTTPGWGLPNISSLDEIDCYMVLVEQPTEAANTCYGTAGASVIKPYLSSGLSEPGATIELELDAGNGRRFAVLGFAKLASASCEDYKSDAFSRSKFSAPTVVAEKTADLYAGEQTLTMILNMTGTPTLQGCEGPDFNAHWMPSIPSPAYSVVTSAAATLQVAEGITVTLTAKNFHGNRITVGGEAVVFTLSGGTSAGTFSAVTDHGDGTYSATLTGTVMGTASTLGATVGGKVVTTALSTLTVTAPSISLANSLVTISGSTVASGGTRTLTLATKDAVGNPISDGGRTVVFTLSGGTSSGTISAVTDNADGTYSAVFTATAAGTATGVSATVGGLPLTSSPASILVSPGALSLSNSVTTVGAAAIFSTAQTTVSVSPKDAFGNLLGAGQTVVFSNTGGTSGGTFGGVTHNGSGVYSATFTGSTAGTATSILATINSQAVTSSLPTITVNAGVPVSVALTGPTSIPAGDCSSAFTSTLKDAGGNTTTYASLLVLTLSGQSGGQFYSDASCTSQISTLSFSGGVGTANFYYKNPIVEALNLASNGSVLSLTGGSLVVSTQPSMAWLGGSVTTQWEATGGYSVGGKRDGFLLNPFGLYTDGNGYLYVADSLNNRIVKYSLGGGFQGWVGQVGEPPTGGSGGCAGTAVGQATPGWCTGGFAAQTASTTVAAGGMWLPGSITGDGTYIYVTNYSLNRIERFNAASGAYAGWIGKVSFTAPSSGAGGCTSTTNATTPGWCYGGTSTSGTGDGQFTGMRGIFWNSGYLYVADTSNHRIQKINASTGVLVGWIGKIGTSPTGGDAGCTGASVGTVTLGWCTGGAAATGTADGNFQNPMGIWGDGTYLYVGNQGGVKISKITMATGSFQGWIGNIASPTGLGGAVGCSGASASTFTPGWCTGGTATSGASNNGTFAVIAGITGDGTYLYVADSTYARISKYTLAGAYVGWIGRAAGGGASGAGGCSSMVNGSVTPGWCTGGSVKLGSGDGEYSLFNSLSVGLAVDSGNLYITDSGNSRLVKVASGSGQYLAWSGGRAQSASAWSRTTNLTGLDSAAGELFSNTNLPSSIDGLGAGLVVTGADVFAVDLGNNALKRYDQSTGQFLGWRGAVERVPTSGAAGCTSTAVGTPTTGLCLGGALTFGTANGSFNGPYGAATDGTSYYVTDMAGRIQRFNISTGAMTGWLGKISSVTGLGGAAGCSGATVNTFTPGWCTGGLPTTGNGDGMLTAPRSIVVSGGSIFVTDAALHRINQYTLSTGAFVGWIGKVATNSGMGGAAGCSGAATNAFTPGWCTGGTSGSGTGNGMLSSPGAIAADGTYLYVADENNSRVMKFDQSTGAFIGWIGKVGNNSGLAGGAGCAGTANSAMTPAWCTGGLSATTGGSFTPEGAFSYIKGLTVQSGYLYVSDAHLNKNVIQRYDAATGSYQGWRGTVLTPPTGGAAGCVSTPSGQFTPGWCVGGSPSPARTGELGFDSPAGLTSDSNYIFIQDTGNSRLMRLPRN